jgi:hypothetical protein
MDYLSGSSGEGTERNELKQHFLLKISNYTKFSLIKVIIKSYNYFILPDINKEFLKLSLLSD